MVDRMQNAEDGRVQEKQTENPAQPGIVTQGEYLEVAFRARALGLFSNPGPPVDVGTMAVVTVERGEDLGRVVGKYTTGETLPGEPVGAFARAADASDLERFRSNQEFESKVLAYCRERVKTRRLDMKLTGCESQLDRRKIRVYFTAEQRTDFRALVRDLAAEFRARIEMRQIGVRDEARHRDGVGICGLRLCCAAFLREFTSVTLKSVREQNLAPNPSKVSGACSRLMCCLAYEADFYRKAGKVFPEVGSRHRIDGRNASVLACDIFHDRVTIAWEQGGTETLDIAEFLRMRSRSRLRKPGEPDSDEDAAEQAPSDEKRSDHRRRQ
jgi:cell fate regulator YaaT (PSP1 superfamily)